MENTSLLEENSDRDLSGLRLCEVNYTEEKIKDKISHKEKEISQILDVKSSTNVQENKEYENWATKHNLKMAASTVVEMRNQGFKSLLELQAEMSPISFQKNEDMKAFKKLSFEQKRIKEVNKREHYKGCLLYTSPSPRD